MAVQSQPLSSGVSGPTHKHAGEMAQPTTRNINSELALRRLTYDSRSTDVGRSNEPTSRHIKLVGGAPVLY